MEQAARVRAKQRAKKAAANQSGAAAAIEAPPQVLAIPDKDRSTGAGKGRGKGKKGNSLPKGAAAQTQDGKRLCYAYNRREKCVQTPCNFLHACWFCVGDHAGCEKKCKRK